MKLMNQEELAAYHAENHAKVVLEISEQKDNIAEAARLLGWAHFNLYKNKNEAVHVLIDKALVALGMEPWHDSFQAEALEKRGKEPHENSSS